MSRATDAGALLLCAAFAACDEDRRLGAQPDGSCIEGMMERSGDVCVAPAFIANITTGPLGPVPHCVCPSNLVGGSRP